MPDPEGPMPLPMPPNTPGVVLYGVVPVVVPVPVPVPVDGVPVVGVVPMVGVVVTGVVPVPAALITQTKESINAQPTCCVSKQQKQKTHYLTTSKI